MDVTRMDQTKIDYSVGKMPWRRRRRTHRLLIGGALSLLALFVLSLVPRVVRFFRIVHWRSECMNYSPPADQIVYEEGVTPGMSVLEKGFDFAGFPVRTPNCLTELWKAKEWPDHERYPSDRPLQHPEFLHELRSLQRGAELVSVYFGGWNDRRNWYFFFLVYDLNETFPSDAELEIPEHRLGTLRLFAGQRDPSDPAHFTLAYELEGQKGTIDGWLQNDKHVNLQIRDGPAKKP